MRTLYEDALGRLVDRIFPEEAPPPQFCPHCGEEYMPMIADRCYYLCEGL